MSIEDLLATLELPVSKLEGFIILWHVSFSQTQYYGIKHGEQQCSGAGTLYTTASCGELEMMTASSNVPVYTK